MLYINTFEPYHVTHNAYRVANLNEYLECIKKIEEISKMAFTTWTLDYHDFSRFSYDQVLWNIANFKATWSEI